MINSHSDDNTGFYQENENNSLMTSLAPNMSTESKFRNKYLLHPYL